MGSLGLRWFSITAPGPNVVNVLPEPVCTQDKSTEAQNEHERVKDGAKVSHLHRGWLVTDRCQRCLASVCMVHGGAMQQKGALKEQKKDTNRTEVFLQQLSLGASRCDTVMVPNMCRAAIVASQCCCIVGLSKVTGH